MMGRSLVFLFYSVLSVRTLVALTVGSKFRQLMIIVIGFNR